MYVEMVSMSIQTNSEYELSKIPIQHRYYLTIKRSWSTDVEECIDSESDTDDDIEPEGNDPIKDACLDKRGNVWANVE